MARISLVLLLILSFYGCAMTDFYAQKQLSFINYGKNVYPPHEKDYPIDLFFQDKPQKQIVKLKQVALLNLN